MRSVARFCSGEGVIPQFIVRGTAKITNTAFQFRANTIVSVEASGTLLSSGAPTSVNFDFTYNSTLLITSCAASIKAAVSFESTARLIHTLPCTATFAAGSAFITNTPSYHVIGAHSTLNFAGQFSTPNAYQYFSGSSSCASSVARFHVPLSRAGGGLLQFTGFSDVFLLQLIGATRAQIPQGTTYSLPATSDVIASRA